MTDDYHEHDEGLTSDEIEEHYAASIRDADEVRRARADEARIRDAEEVQRANHTFVHAEHPDYPGRGAWGTAAEAMAARARIRDVSEIGERARERHAQGVRSGSYVPLAEDSMMTEALPDRVVHELAILESRALRAEARAESLTKRCERMAETVDSMNRQTAALEGGLDRARAAADLVKVEVERALTSALAARAR